MEQSHRVMQHPVLGELKRDEIDFSFDGRPMIAQSGDVITSALLANGERSLGITMRSGKPRALYCAIGHCYECQITVDGQAGVRACITRVTPGMRVEPNAPVLVEVGSDR